MDLQQQILESHRKREDADREWRHQIDIDDKEWREQQAERDHQWRETQSETERKWREQQAEEERESRRQQELIATRHHRQNMAMLWLGIIIAAGFGLLGSIIQADWIQKPGTAASTALDAPSENEPVDEPTPNDLPHQ